MERITLKNEKNAFVTDCNDLSSVFEDKNKLEHKLSMQRRKIVKMLKSSDTDDAEIERTIQATRYAVGFSPEPNDNVCSISFLRFCCLCLQFDYQRT